MEYNPNEEALKPLIETLEAKRQTLLEYKETNKGWYWMPLGLLMFCFLLSLAYTTVLLLCFMVLLCLGLFIKAKKINTYLRAYNSIYKETFVKPFVQIFYPKVSYLPGKFSTSKNIKASLLYDTVGLKEELSCEDGFRGKTAEGLSFTMMEVLTELDLGSKVSVKRALFVSIELPKKGYRPVFVASKLMIKPILERYHELERDYVDVLLQQTGFGAAFDDKYEVYSAEKENATALLNAPFLAVIQKLEKQWTEEIRLSFVKDTLHIALSSQNNFFEADLEQVVLANGLGQELFEQLSTCLTAVEELNAVLNQIKLPSEERMSLPGNLDLPKQNWDDTAYDHFIDNKPKQ